MPINWGMLHNDGIFYHQGPPSTRQTLRRLCDGARLREIFSNNKKTLPKCHDVKRDGDRLTLIYFSPKGKRETTAELIATNDDDAKAYEERLKSLLDRRARGRLEKIMRKINGRYSCKKVVRKGRRLTVKLSLPNQKKTQTFHLAFKYAGSAKNVKKRIESRQRAKPPSQMRKAHPS